MTEDDAPKSLNDIALAHHFQLEELLDRSALSEMAHSFEALFGVPMRVYASSGALLLDAEAIPALYSFLEGDRQGRKAVLDMITKVRGTVPQRDEVLMISCVSGANYITSAIEYEGRVLGRAILGPFVSGEITEPPVALKEVASGLDQDKLREVWDSLPRLETPKARKLDQHLRANLDLLVFSGLKAHLASSMHMASVQESFRELSDKNHQLQVAYDRLKELDRLKSNFLATVSHELRTPLTSIIGYSEMILEGIAGEISEEQREFVDTIHEKGEQLLELIKSLLDLSKLESGTMSLHRGDVDCGKLVSQVVSTMAPLARAREVHLVCEADEGLPILQADVDRLRQVLNNLSENAIKFTPQSGTVTIKASKIYLGGEDLGGVGGSLMGATQRPAIELRVIDTGIGIPKDERHRVFDAFYQVDSSSTRQVGGTGLGLSIVKRLVDAHDGTIRVEENSPCGAIFVVVLPIFKR